MQLVILIFLALLLQPETPCWATVYGKYDAESIAERTRIRERADAVLDDLRTLDDTGIPLTSVDLMTLVNSWIDLEKVMRDFSGWKNYTKILEKAAPFDPVFRSELSFALLNVYFENQRKDYFEKSSPNITIVKNRMRPKVRKKPTTQIAQASGKAARQIAETQMKAMTYSERESLLVQVAERYLADPETSRAAEDFLREVGHASPLVEEKIVKVYLSAQNPANLTWRWSKKALFHRAPRTPKAISTLLEDSKEDRQMTTLRIVAKTKLDPAKLSDAARKQLGASLVTAAVQPDSATFEILGRYFRANREMTALLERAELVPTNERALADLQNAIGEYVQDVVLPNEETVSEETESKGPRLKRISSKTPPSPILLAPVKAPSALNLVKVPRKLKDQKNDDARKTIKEFVSNARDIRWSKESHLRITEFSGPGNTKAIEVMEGRKIYTTDPRHTKKLYWRLLLSNAIEIVHVSEIEVSEKPIQKGKDGVLTIWIATPSGASRAFSILKSAAKITKADRSDLKEFLSPVLSSCEAAVAQNHRSKP